MPRPHARPPQPRRGLPPLPHPSWEHGAEALLHREKITPADFWDKLGL